MLTHHDWEEDRGRLDVLDDPESDEARELDEGEEVDPVERHAPQVRPVKGHIDYSLCTAVVFKTFTGRAGTSWA